MERLQVTELSDGQAKSAGIMIGDWLDEYNGIKLTSSEALSAAMRKSSGSHMMKVIRNLQRIEIPIIAGALGISVEVGEVVDIDDQKAMLQVMYEQAAKDIKLSTIPEIPGTSVSEVLEIVTAECVFGMGVFKDFFTGMSDFFGGRSQTTQEILRSARKTCLNELKIEAAKVGGNAVIGVRLDYSEFSGQGKSMLFLVASGTAVKIK